MAIRSDTHAPKTIEPALGLRIQAADELVLGLPDLGALLGQKPVQGEHCLDFLRRLRLGTTPEEAPTFAGFALLPRQGVWWAHECLKAVSEVLSPLDLQQLALIAAWVGAPDEDHRYACLQVAQSSKPIGPGAWACFAVGWSGGSMSAPGLPAVSPPASAMGKALNLSLMGALAMVPRDHRRRRLEHFIAIAEVMAKSA